MKPLKHFAKYAIVSIAPVFFGIACAPLNANNGGGTTETTSGNILGTIWNLDGTPAKNVSVRLIPVNFSPYFARDNFTIDSTKTDENGAYSFQLKSSGFFNMSAQGNGKYCYEDSIYGTKNGRMKVRDDTLKAPGSISGVARLLSGDDNREIVILVLGTNTYASPPDTSGAFAIAALAEGKYQLRFLTTNTNYGYLDTTLMVISGKNTAITGTVCLPFEGVPAVGPVAARLDPHSMTVRLSWPACDTSNIAAFYLFRNTGITGPPFAIINSTDTSFTDDVVLLNPDFLAYGDTLRYSMAAVGKNRTLGRLSTAPDVLLKSFLGPMTSIKIEGINSIALETAMIQADKKHNIYLYGDGWISKIDSSGRVLAQYDCDSVNEGGYPADYFTCIAVDNNQNVYSFQKAPRILEKYSPDLKLEAKILVDSVISDGQYGMAFDGSGLLYLFLYGGPDSTWIKVFDTTLSLVDSGTIHESCALSQIHNDTLIVGSYKGFKAYDSHFNYLRKYAFDDMVDKYCYASPKGWHIISDINFSANNTALVFFSQSDETYFFLAVDSSNKLQGRCHLISQYGFQYAFDGVDRLYVYNGSSQRVYVYKIN